jgi:hypothetical protein
MFLNTQPDKLSKVLIEVKKKIIQDHDKDKPIKSELMKKIFLFANLLIHFTRAILEKPETGKFIYYCLEYSPLVRDYKPRVQGSCPRVGCEFWITKKTEP